MSIILDYAKQPHEIASIVRRIEAGLNTGVAILFFWIVLSFALHIIPVDVFLVSWGVNSRLAEPITSLMFALAPLIYVVLDAGRSKSTYGMRLRKLVYRRFDGTVADFWCCFWRECLGILLIPALPISLVLLLKDPLHRTLADRIAGTVVCLVS